MSEERVLLYRNTNGNTSPLAGSTAGCQTVQTLSGRREGLIGAGSAGAIAPPVMSGAG